MKNLIKILFLSFTIALFFSCSKDDTPPSCEMLVNDLKMNQIQVLGSHNSYKKKPAPAIVQLMLQYAHIFPAGFSPDAWDYEHLPLTEQFNDYGIRSIELDVYNDPDGGLFYHRRANALLGLPTDSGIDELAAPGLKVQHFPDLDYETNYYSFISSLTEVKSWSDANPNHLPLFVMVEPKEDNPADLLPDLVQTIPFDKQSLEGIEMEIKSVFGNDLNNVITPDRVRGSFTTLREAVLAGNWPTIEEARGKVVFIMLGSGTEKGDYLDGHASLEGRTMFMYADPQNPEAAFLKMDDPIANENEIESLVAQGFMIRTRADANTIEARTGDYSRWEAALRSGAQIISTDYYRADARAASDDGWTDYAVGFMNNQVAVMNPVNGDAEIDCDITE